MHFQRRLSARVPTCCLAPWNSLQPNNTFRRSMQSNSCIVLFLLVHTNVLLELGRVLLCLLNFDSHRLHMVLLSSFLLTLVQRGKVAAGHFNLSKCYELLGFQVADLVRWPLDFVLTRNCFLRSKSFKLFFFLYWTWSGFFLLDKFLLGLILWVNASSRRIVATRHFSSIVVQNLWLLRLKFDVGRVIATRKQLVQVRLCKLIKARVASALNTLHSVLQHILVFIYLGQRKPWSGLCV